MSLRPIAVAGLLALPVLNASAETTRSERLKKETVEAADALKTWTLDQKEQYLKKMRTQYEELEPEIDQLKAKAEDAKKEATTELGKYVDDLDVKKALLEKKLDEFTTASKAALGDVKEGVDEAWKDLRKAYNKAKGRFE